MRLQSLGSLLLLLLTSSIFLPLAIALQKLWKKQRIDSSKFFGMSINIDKEPKETLSFVQELNIKNLLIRFPMWEISKIATYKEWISSFKDGAEPSRSHLLKQLKPAETARWGR